MLLWFTLGNYRSFKDKATLSLQATSSDELEETNVYHKDGLRILKTAAIYGPNGGGKSNFLSGLSFMTKFVKESSTKMQIGEPIGVEPFLLSEETEKKPSYFELAFKTESGAYQYGFEADTNEVKREWLYQTVDRKRALLFQREGLEIKVGRKFGAGKPIKKMTRNNSLFLSVASQFNVQASKEIFDWFGKITDLRSFPIAFFQLGTGHNYDDSTLIGKELIQMLNILGIGSERVSVEVLPADAPIPFSGKWLETLLSVGNGNIYRLNIHHAKRNMNGALIGTTGFDVTEMESLGTQKIMALLPFLITVLKSSQLLLVDELESSLHPILARAILQLIHQKTVTNGGQVVFTTHDTNLLSSDLLRRDQVWLTPKNQREESNLVSLVEYKVKKEHNMEKGYLEGRYGAIPYIGSMEPKIITPSNGKETRKTAKKKS